MIITELLNSHLDKKIAIIGVGNIGQELILYLKDQKCDREIVCVVDDGYKEIDSYMCVSILEMSEFLRSKRVEEFIFFNTITSRETCKYHKVLNENGISNIIDVNTIKMQADLSVGRVKKFLLDQGISLDYPEVKIGDFLYPNPFLNLPIGISLSFARDAGDLIFPVWLGNESTCISGPYESEHVKISRGDIVIDVGANIGIGVANAIAKGAEQVYAIEPVINEMILKLQKLYGEKMKLIECAIGNFEGKVNIRVNPEITRNSSIYNATDDDVIKKTVDMVTLDKFIEKEGLKRVDFIKIYLDDKELGAIKGAKEVLKKMHPKLAIFPFSSGNTKEFKQSVHAKILEINSDYKIEYRYEKVFAYV